MRFKIQVVIDNDDQQETIEEIVTLDKPADHLDQVGLTLAEFAPGFFMLSFRSYPF